MLNGSSTHNRWRNLASGLGLLLIALLVSGFITPSFLHGAEQLQVVLPTAGSVYKPGDLLKIEWAYPVAPQPFPAIAYLTRVDAGAADRIELGWNIQPDQAAVTTFDWFIPNSVPAGQYTVTIANFNASIQQSSGAFTIAGLPLATQVRLLYPPQAAGSPLSAFALGSTIGIRWDFPAGAPTPIDLYLDIFSNTALRSSLLIAANLLPDPLAASQEYAWSVQVPSDRVPPQAQYKLRAVAAGSVIGSSADFFTITGATSPADAPAPAAGTDDRPNLVQNSSFEITAAQNSFPGWVFGARPGVVATLSQDRDIHTDRAAAARIDIAQGHPVDWYAQLSQGGLPLSNGTDYLLSFWARASAPRVISVVLQRDSAPWSEYYYREIGLTEEWKQYSFAYASTIDDARAALRLNLARSVGQVWLDDVSLVAVAAVPPPAPAETPLPNGQGGSWRMVFQDEFDGNTQDSSKWVNCYLFVWSTVGCDKTSGTSASWYMPDDVLLGGGTLKLRAQRRTVSGTDGNSYAYSSGLISSGKDTYDPAVAPRFAFQYGFAEMRAKIPAGQGLWSAFWMLQANGQWPWEIDILEVLGHQPGTAHMTTHYPTPTWDDATSSADYNGPDLSADFHTYAIEWSPDRLVWYIDGVERKRDTDPSHIPHAPMFLMANLQVGGDWPGMPDATTPFPAQLELDYIRVWQQP